MISFSRDIDFARSILARNASYLVLLLEARKSSCMAYPIFSLIGDLSCKPTPAPV